MITVNGGCGGTANYGAIAMLDNGTVTKHNLISQRKSKNDQSAINSYLSRIVNKVRTASETSFQTLSPSHSLDDHYLSLYIQKVRPYSFHDVELKVDYKERERVKHLGAFWDAVIKKWVISSANPDFALFEQWHPQDDLILHITYIERREARKAGAYFDSVGKKWKINPKRVNKSVYEKWLPENNPRIYLNIPKNRKNYAHDLLHLNWDSKYQMFFTYPSNPDFDECKQWITTEPLVEPVKPVKSSVRQLHQPNQLLHLLSECCVKKA